MPKKRSGPEVPDELNPHVEAIAEGLAALAAGDDFEDEATQRFLAAVTAANRLRQEDEVADDPYSLATGMGGVTSNRMRELRVETGLTQKALAEAMWAAGYEWNRGTVADTEAKRRELDLDELVGLAALFGVPVVELMLPAPGEHLEVSGGERPGVSMSSRQGRELVLGRGAVPGKGGPLWSAAATAVPPGIERPAKTLWQKRRAAEMEGQ